MTRSTRRWLWSLAAAILLTAGVLSGARAMTQASVVDAANDPAMLRSAPNITGTTLTGETADLNRLRGSVVVINVWASWCAPCRNELPVLADAQDWYGSKVAFLGVLTRDTPRAAQALLVETGAMDLVSVLDPDGTIAVSLGATGVPETFVVDPAGLIRARHVGPVTPAWLRQQLDALVGD